MTVIRPNSISGVTSITAQGGDINVYRADGTKSDIFINNITGVAATFTGNLNVGGVLTYEDVTNIDSVGIITARAAVSIADSIVHTGDTNTSLRFPAADTITAETGGLERLRIDSNGTLGVNLTTPKTTKGIHISKGVSDGGIGNSYSLANEYLHFGYSEHNSSGDKGLFTMGFGYVAGGTPATNSPAYLGYRETSVSGYTNGALVFATRSATSDSAPTERLRITSDGQVTIGGELHIGSKLVHDGDTDTHINFSSNTIVTTAGNVTKMNVNNTMVEINGVVQFQGGRTYSTNSTSTWTNILSFSNATTNGFFFECAVSENNYSTIYKVGGSPNWNSCYFTSDHAGDSNHAHSSDITFRLLNDSGTKRLQFKAVSYTTTRYLYAINVWVRTGYVNWS